MPIMSVIWFWSLKNIQSYLKIAIYNVDFFFWVGGGGGVEHLFVCFVDVNSSGETAQALLSLHK